MQEIEAAVEAVGEVALVGRQVHLPDTGVGRGGGALSRPQNVPLAVEGEGAKGAEQGRVIQQHQVHVRELEGGRILLQQLKDTLQE